MKTLRKGALARTIFAALWISGFAYSFPLRAPDWLSEKVHIQNRPLRATIAFANGVITIGGPSTEAPLTEAPQTDAPPTGAPSRTVSSTRDSASPNLPHKCCEARTRSRS